MLNSSNDNQKYAQRAVEREQRLREEQKKADKQIQECCLALRKKHEEEIEKEHEKSRKLEETKKAELIEIRSTQARELSDFEVELLATINERIATRAEEGKLEVEKKMEELKKVQKEVEAQLAYRKEHQLAASKFLENTEKRRQECLNHLRDQRKKERNEMNAAVEEIKQKLQDTTQAGEERLLMLKEKRTNEEKEHLFKKRVTNETMALNSSNMSSSLALEDGFELFKQECKELRNRHNKFTIAYDTMQPTLLRVSSRMQAKMSIGDCDFEELTSSFRVFKERANAFKREGCSFEGDVKKDIGDVIEILRQLGNNINDVQFKIEEYEEEEEEEEPGKVDRSASFTECLKNMDDLIKTIGELIQKFNVIGEDNIQATLAVQMKDVQSKRYDAIGDGPQGSEEDQSS